MPCYHPIHGYYSRERNESGKRSIVFNSSQGYIDRPIDVPCGKCIGCRLERSRQWAVRCVHEASLYDQNCFITLTFADTRASLCKADFQKFMKRLRKKFGSGVRYFHCGEYGEKFGRPHHHACLFNFDFPDKVLYSVREGVKLYRSRMLESLWPYGFSTVGDVTFASAAYVARYVVKKVNGEKAKEHYGDKVPEYVTMSRRPGIGRDWYEEFSNDIFPNDFVVVNGVKCQVPEYYNRCYDLTNPEEYATIVNGRIERAKASPDNEYNRLKAREVCEEARISRLNRGYEQS